MSPSEIPILLELSANALNKLPSTSMLRSVTRSLQRARTRNDVRCCVEPDFGSESFVFVLREAHELPVTAGGWVRHGESWTKDARTWFAPLLALQRSLEAQMGLR